MSEPDLSWKIKEMAISNGVQPGEVFTVESEPHTSWQTPYLHVDILTVLYEGDGNFSVLAKDHVPV